MSETTYDTQLDDSGYSEPFTVEDFIREAYTESRGLTGDPITIHWYMLRNESRPRTIPKDSWSLGVYRGDGIYENNFTSKLIHS